MSETFEEAFQRKIKEKGVIKSKDIALEEKNKPSFKDPTKSNKNPILKEKIKKDKQPNKKRNMSPKAKESETKAKFEPTISWYRGQAELLAGGYVKGTRGSKIDAIDVMIIELEKRKLQLISKM
ncbi:hypothetical protein NEF87_000215 [Candidatus Lokiarchaeum ossiferum]|uniref:Uncharacterized protein n=1 Tax=Candidatus Lokiarchaeum ossiferum TaxID=2951803 RepID=A0ABY6HK81_9ARCH|nr:hypothetical protein NEF87_000215 [Candidatus Lokiarchaeum sp. B-35]